MTEKKRNAGEMMKHVGGIIENLKRNQTREADDPTDVVEQMTYLIDRWSKKQPTKDGVINSIKEEDTGHSLPSLQPWRDNEKISFYGPPKRPMEQRNLATQMDSIKSKQDQRKSKR